MSRSWARDEFKVLKIDEIKIEMSYHLLSHRESVLKEI